LVGNDAITGYFDKRLIIKGLWFLRFFGVANSVKSRRLYGVKATALRRGSTVSTPWKHRLYAVKPTQSRREGNLLGPKTDCGHCQRADTSRFPTLKAPVFMC